MKTLTSLRTKIDKIDASLVKLLARRQRLSQQIGAYKNQHGKSIINPRREKQILAQQQQLCVQYQLNVTYVERIFKTIIAYSRRLQRYSESVKIRERT